MGGDLPQAVAVLDVRDHGQAGRWNEEDLTTHTPAVLVRIPDLGRIDRDEFFESWWSAPGHEGQIPLPRLFP